ncbi:DNA repair exonuclease [Chelativorans sp. ZYF759]|uniref:metallophosphoesterase family protein n=1 Tax=Chelativorans sp. ZYF759 TaxID=2692213 RepID=UPI00145E632D|nr:DNA repair exonuclease [Chelativorans sp. ZYF759]NMG39623.1 DNA repair exonuclease [Chelativorans sp. ZYF759]
MTSFRFLHAADLHLGSPFLGLAVKDAQVAELFARATRDAFSRLVTVAIESKVAFMVIAGDIYDGEWRDNSIGLFFNREMARLDRAGIPVVLVKGNHDADSVVTRSITMPESVRQFASRKPSTIVLDDIKVALHGQSFADRAAPDNLALAYPDPVPGHFNIGVLHTSLTGRPPHANYAPCSVADLRSRGYDYWALGHVHDYELVAEHPHIVFPGNIQGRNVRETGAKGGVLVAVDGGRVAGLERVFVDQARFAQVGIDISQYESLPDILRACEATCSALLEGADDVPHAIRLKLAGETPLKGWLLAERSQLTDELQAACHRVSADFWLEKLVLDLASPPLGSPRNGEVTVELAALVDAVLADPALATRAEEIVQEIRAKMPFAPGEGDGLSGESISELLAEAREVALARSMENRE